METVKIHAVEISTQQICELFPGLVTEVLGEHAVVHGIAAADEFGSGDLIFTSDSDLIGGLGSNQPGAVVTDSAGSEKIDGGLSCPVLVVSDVRVAQAMIRQEFDDYLFRDEEWGGIHPTSLIHESARLGSNTVIGPGVVIGARCVIGNNVTIRANSVIEHDVAIGDDTVIHSLVNIGYDCRIGSRVIIKPNTVIGAEGFGLARDENHEHHRIPQTGNVIIEDDVLLGSQCNVDRGTFGSTVIRRRCKLDAQIHIAHNCDIGEDTVIVAQCGISGSSKIGKRVVFSGQSATLDHAVVGDDIVLVHRSGVKDELLEPGMYAGTPVETFKDYVRRRAGPRNLAKLEKRVRELEARLKEIES